MASLRIEGVQIVGIVNAVPDRIRTQEDDAARFGVEEMQRVVKNTGVTRRSVADYLCTSDLCYAAATRLLEVTGWAKDSIDAVILVTQTPDYPSPATACLLQHRLGLAPSVAAFDINLGCSGYTYGLWVVASLLAAGKLKRALLLAGDVVSRAAAPTDRAVVPLFGDAGSATALECRADAPPMVFEMGTNGSGGIHLHTLAGAAKHPIREIDLLERKRKDGVVRSNQHTYMNGAEVLTFAMVGVPPMIEALRTAAGWTPADIDYYVFHQASRFMLKNIGRILRISPTGKQLVIGLEGYGNTSSASIPLAMNDQLTELTTTRRKIVMAGFGIGWSWCAVAIEMMPIIMPDILRVPDVLHPGEFESLPDHEFVNPSDV
ncbi:MAG: ketoacyl-ACP synthase III [Deltaproteobacteria bacterium]|nr:ketoacyl-ACP synthase III [Deltaproteobacteria bacterium]